MSQYINNHSIITGDAYYYVTFSSFPSPTLTRIEILQYQRRGTAHLVMGRFDQTLGLDYGHSISAAQDPNNGDSRQIGERVKLDWQGNVGIADGHVLVLGTEMARDALHPGLSFGFPSPLS